MKHIKTFEASVISIDKKNAKSAVKHGDLNNLKGFISALKDSLDENEYKSFITSLKKIKCISSNDEICTSIKNYLAKL